jgi:hypothetical protein
VDEKAKEKEKDEGMSTSRGPQVMENERCSPTTSNYNHNPFAFLLPSFPHSLTLFLPFSNTTDLCRER